MRGERAGGRNYVLSLVARISFVTLAAPLSLRRPEPWIRHRRETRAPLIFNDLNTPASGRDGTGRTREVSDLSAPGRELDERAL